MKNTDFLVEYRAMSLHHPHHTCPVVCWMPNMSIFTVSTGQTRPSGSTSLRFRSYMQILSTQQAGLHMINTHSLTQFDLMLGDARSGQIWRHQLHRWTSATNNIKLGTFTFARRQTLIFVLQKIIKQKLDFFLTLRSVLISYFIFILNMKDDRLVF